MRQFFNTLTFLIVGISSASAQSIYTSTEKSACRPIGRQFAAAIRCPGPAGYSLVIADEGNMIALTAGPTGKEKAASDHLAFPGADGRAYGRLAEWRMRENRPVALILRIWRRDLDRFEGHDYATVEELLVVSVDSRGARHLAAVDAKMPEANIAARAIADGSERSSHP